MNQKTHFGYETIDRDQKNGRVAEVFNSVADNYDLMNDLMSGGLHRLWKDWYVWQTDARPGESVLDLAAGTGDIAKRLARRMVRDGDLAGRLVVSDINEAMLNIGRRRLIQAGWLQNVEFTLANAEQLPFADDSFDLITMAFGLRNVTNQQQALNEMRRVLKPGGRVLVLEFSQPQHFNRLYDWYSFNVLPQLGAVFANDRASYQYLAESIRMHPKQEPLKAMFQAAGLSQCEYQNLSGGICAIHKGVKC